MDKYNIGDQVSVRFIDGAEKQSGVVTKDDSEIDGTYFIELSDGHGCWVCTEDIEPA